MNIFARLLTVTSCVPGAGLNGPPSALGIRLQRRDVGECGKRVTGLFPKQTFGFVRFLLGCFFTFSPFFTFLPFFLNCFFLIFGLGLKSEKGNSSNLSFLHLIIFVPIYKAAAIWVYFPIQPSTLKSPSTLQQTYRTANLPTLETYNISTHHYTTTSFCTLYISLPHLFAMDQIKVPKEQEQKDTRPLNVEEYQKKWDQMLEDTAKQIEKIRGEFQLPTYAEVRTDSYHRK